MVEPNSEGDFNFDLNKCYCEDIEIHHQKNNQHTEEENTNKRVYMKYMKNSTCIYYLHHTITLC